MNYELAKKLKDAGFPQNPKSIYFNEEESMGLPPIWIDGCYVPTLSELIEACGEGLGYDQMVHVSTYPKNKKAFAYIRINEIQEGSTPEEAVAHLYLELNKK